MATEREARTVGLDDLVGPDEACKAWWDAIWLGDREHGQCVPEPSDKRYDEYVSGLQIARGAWFEAGGGNRWRRMDSAPRDGTLVLVCGGWMRFSDRDYEPARFGSVAIAGFNARGEWQGDTGSNDEYVIHEPGYWMALPPPFRPNA